MAEQDSMASGEIQQKCIQWEKCILCQETSDDLMQCPADTKRKEFGLGYESLAKNIERFYSLESLPFHLDIITAIGSDSSVLKNAFIIHKA